MSHQLTFATRATYDTRLEGITIEACLVLGTQSVTCQVKIDTGGQACLFMHEMAETLGIAIETGHRRVFNTLAGSLPAYGHSVTLCTLGLEFDSLVYFAADYGLPGNLLGREGWLQKVRFAVVDYDAVLYLRSYLRSSALSLRSRRQHIAWGASPSRRGSGTIKPTQWAAATGAVARYTG